MSKTLIIDGDWLCFSTAIALQKENPFGDAEPMFDESLGQSVFNSKIKKWKTLFETNKVEVHFSCNRADNWRRDVVSDYKAHRDGTKKPVGLKPMIEYAKKMYEWVEEPRLEADDTLAIAATGRLKDDCVIISVDKDFLTVPTQIYNPQKNVLKKQSKADAFKFFIYQTIIGDSADGYKGIFRVGPKGAMKFILKHSKNLYNIWEPLCELASKKHDEEYMLTQARLAHILWDADYTDGEVRLWEPEHIKEML